MQDITTISALRTAVDALRRRGPVALVPTMGNLHEGHLALVDRARELSASVVVSIFVNPMQFGAGEDLDAYPRTLDDDRAALRARGADLLFHPEPAEVYPAGTAAQTRVSVPGLSDILCGASRPGHFDGVTTVVCKLLNMVQPDVAVFGRKDYQQLLLIRTMVRDLCMPVTIEAVATARAPDGLALSSRNRYLTAEQRERAPALQATLRDLAAALRDGRRDFGALEEQGRGRLLAAGLQPDYLRILHEDLSEPVAEADRFMILGAAHLGRARLIDNLCTSEPH